MDIFKWSKDKIKKMDLVDMAALKTLCTLTGMVVGAYFPGFVKQYVAVFVLIILLLAAKLIHKIYLKK